MLLITDALPGSSGAGGLGDPALHAGKRNMDRRHDNCQGSSAGRQQRRPAPGARRADCRLERQVLFMMGATFDALLQLIQQPPSQSRADD